MTETKLTKKQEQQERAAKARASRVEMLERQLAEAKTAEAERNIKRIEAKAAELAKSVNTLEKQQTRVNLLQDQYSEMLASIEDEFGAERAHNIAAQLELEHNIVFIAHQAHAEETPAQAEARVDEATDAEQPALFDLPGEGPTPESIETAPKKRRNSKTATV